MTSTNGTDWVERSTAITLDFTGVAYGNGLFAATSHNQVYESNDGVRWASRLMVNGGTLNAVTFGHGMFVAVGSDDFLRQNIFVSTNGVEWQSRSVRITSLSLRAVAGDDSGFAVVGDRAWGAFAFPNLGGWFTGELLDYWPLRILGVAANSGQFVAVGEQGTVATARPFGQFPHSWSSNLQSRTTEALNAVAFDGSRFVAVGGKGVILTSENGETWMTRRSNAGAELFGVTHGQDVWIAVGEGGDILRSADGVEWTEASHGPMGSMAAATRWKDGGVVVGQAGMILTSPDGQTWAPQRSGTDQNLTGITSSGSLLVCTGEEGTVLTSINGTNWFPRLRVPGQSLGRIAFGGGRFVAVGTQWDVNQTVRTAQVLVSTNGTDWSLGFNLPDSTLEDVTYGNGSFVVVGADDRRGIGLVVTSSDSVRWEGFSVGSLPPYPARLHGTAYGNGRFVAVGDGILLTSQNGQDWVIPHQNGFYFRGVRFVAGTFVGAGLDGEVGISEDGVNWSPHPTPSSQVVTDILDLDETILMIGSQAHILQSDPVVRLRLRPGSTGQLQISGPVGAALRIESIAELTSDPQWTPVDTLILRDSPSDWKDPRTSNTATGFYRAMLSP